MTLLQTVIDSRIKANAAKHRAKRSTLPPGYHKGSMQYIAAFRQRPISEAELQEMRKALEKKSDGAAAQE